jgi:hypothetical protein
MYKFEKFNMVAIPFMHKVIATLALIIGMLAIALVVVRVYHGH